MNNNTKKINKDTKKFINAIIKAVTNSDETYFNELEEKYPRIKLFLLNTAKPIIKKLLVFKIIPSTGEKMNISNLKKNINISPSIVPSYIRDIDHPLFSKFDLDIKNNLIFTLIKKIEEEFKKNINELKVLGKKVNKDLLDIFFGVTAEYLEGMLNLSDSNIDAKGAEALSKALPNSKIKNLGLGFNNISNKGLEYITNVLPSSNIQSLDLSHNKITYKGFQALAETLPNTKIKELILNSSGIGSKGAEAIASALPYSKIQVLLLGNNRFGYNSDKGAEVLAKALKDSNIQTLYLDGNNIGNIGAEAIAKVLQNSKIKILSLERNNIGDTGKKLLNKLKKSNQKIWIT